jgi:hypothetical protein
LGLAGILLRSDGGLILFDLLVAERDRNCHVHMSVNRRCQKKTGERLHSHS